MRLKATVLCLSLAVTCADNKGILITDEVASVNVKINEDIFRSANRKSTRVSFDFLISFACASLWRVRCAC